MKADDFSFRSPKIMLELFKDLPDAADNTLEIANRVHLSIPMGILQLPHYDSPSNYTSEEYLAKLCDERLPKRYASLTPEIKKRLDYELEVIKKTKRFFISEIGR